MIKITNITNRLNRREFWYNKPIILHYADGIRDNEIKINSGESIQLKLEYIPSDIYKYKMMNLIIVDEIEDEYTSTLIEEKKMKDDENKKQSKVKNVDKDSEQ